MAMREERIYIESGNGGKGGNASWTTRQEELLRDHAHGGAPAVRVALLRELGVERSEHAIEMHASRIHVSLRRVSKCPSCGKLADRINRQSGMCPVCTEAYHVEVQRALCELEEAEIAETRDEGRIDELRREYDAIRQKRSRMRKRAKCGGDL